MLKGEIEMNLYIEKAKMEDINELDNIQKWIGYN